MIVFAIIARGRGAIRLAFCSPREDQEQLCCLVDAYFAQRSFFGLWELHSVRDYCSNIPLLNVQRKSPRTSYRKEEAMKGDRCNKLFVETRLIL